jgi:hypothetical protein
VSARAAGRPATATADAGSAPVEFAAGVALLVLPVTLLVAALPHWVEHQAAARQAAREAARAVTVAADPRAAVADAEALAREVLANHAVAAAAVLEVVVDAPLGSDGRVARGEDVVARVRIRVPVTVTPLTGAIGGFTVTAVHREPVHAYRSLPP